MIEIRKSNLVLSYEKFNFPAGEVGVKLNPIDLRFQQAPGPVTFVVRIHNSEDIVTLAHLVNALRELDEASYFRLFIPYLPYSRQDRVCVPGESFGLRVMLQLIDTMGFDSIRTLDPHSQIASVFLTHKPITQFQIITSWQELLERITKGVRFISPDAGANKKTAELAGAFLHTDFIRADKLRNLNDGTIKETIVYADDLGSQDILICDDICDGGRTFTELSKVLKAKNAGKVILYVTHGIFSKGLDELFNNGIDEIWTTNSYRTDLLSSNPNFHCLNIEKFI